MTDHERIVALEIRLAKAEARIAELEGRAQLGMIGPNPNPSPGYITPPPWPESPFFPSTPGIVPPSWPLPPIVTKAGDTSGTPPASWKLPTTCEPGSVIHCGPDGPVAIKPERDNGERSGSSSGVVKPDPVELTVGRPPMPSKRWLGTV